MSGSLLDVFGSDDDYEYSDVSSRESAFQHTKRRFLKWLETQPRHKRFSMDIYGRLYEDLDGVYRGGGYTGG